MIETLNSLIIPGFLETMYMVFFSTVFAVLLGLPIGVLLLITGENHILPMKGLNMVLSSMVNIFRSLPFIIVQRQENAKHAKAFGEKAKVSIRNIRKDANDEVKKLEKDKVITEDESKKGQDEVQKITDSYTSKIDSLVKEKENELLKV